MSDGHAFVIKIDIADRVYHIYVDSKEQGLQILKEIHTALNNGDKSYLHEDELYSLEGFRKAGIFDK